MKVCELYNKTLDTFRENKIDYPESEARFLICELLEMTSTDYFLKCDNEASQDDLRRIERAVQRRVSGEPLQYIIGSWDFMGRTFKVGEGVLIPRPETELLCLKILKVLKDKKNPVIYDLCSGSGCIGLTLKCEHPVSELYLIEKSVDALSYLEKNASDLCQEGSYRIIKGDVLDFDSFKDLPAADIIVSNPPYIRSDEVPLLQKEVTFEPSMALDGGKDGLMFYRYITEKWSGSLKADGEMFFEIGDEQGEDVKAMFTKIGFDSRVIKDYNKHDRIVKGRKASYDI